ncbi:type II toxin-antitoxin system VapB family antitoxin [Mycobacterium arosiense]|uniref:DUF2191 domain-containing protein n=1 Tax=Mycobacterium arosiense ATCC BAA-1401 = DSM 45069 TaxID=1265311 RepID=A0A1W9ZPF7_MYCAI|nr:type II toxin-antitoxin system VapB family antitoxin [Mycobacterium arosiense]ORA19704.1 hypothetical protein BST14_04755 [Mycobacterium arosiense ATCC BAA-1401 = DSM 45069]
MRKKVEIEVDVDLVDEAIRRFHLLDAREAINLALRTLLSDGDAVEQDDEYDEFSDLSAWQPRPSGGAAP